MDFETIKNWANQNQGLLTIILFVLGGGATFLKWVFDKYRSSPPIVGMHKEKKDINVASRNKTFVQSSGENSTNIQGENIIFHKYEDGK